MDQLKVFKGCLPQILLGLFLNTLTHITLQYIKRNTKGQKLQFEPIGAFIFRHGHTFI